MEGSIQTLGHNSDSFVPFSTAAQARTLAPARVDSNVTAIDSVDIHLLDSLASLCPIYHGLAVYSSRALLDAIGYFNYEVSECEFAVTTEGAKWEGNALQKPRLLDVYPNPASSYLYFAKNSSEAKKITISFKSILGVELHLVEMLEKEFFTRVDISRLVPGMYLLEISNGIYTEVQRIIVE
jgi:hypothetical protein